MVARSRRRSRAGAGSLGERRGRGSGARGTRRSCSGAWVRAARGGDDLPEGGRGNLRSCCQEPTPSVGPPGLDSAPRTWRVWAGSQPRAASVPRAWSGVAPRPSSPWAAGSFVPAPRCPLFLPSAGRRGREEGGSGCPDVSALNDCGAGQSRAGVCRRRAPCLAACGVGAGRAAGGGRPGAARLFSLRGARPSPLFFFTKIGELFFRPSNHFAMGFWL